MAAAPPVLLIGPADRVAAARTLVVRDGIACESAEFPGPPDAALSVFRLVIADGADPQAVAFARRWRMVHGETRRPLLWLADDAGGRAAGWRAGADACLSGPFAVGELTAQIQALLHRQETVERLTHWAAEAGRLNRTLVQIYQQLDADARLARVVQRGFSSADLTPAGRAHFAVSERTPGSAGGSFHFLRRDQARVLIVLGDIGQSLTSRLLAIHVQQTVALNQSLPAPASVLEQINLALLSLNLSEPPLARMISAMIDGATGALSYSTAGHTAPLLVPRDGPPRFQPASGSVLGLAETTFAVQQVQLDAQERLLLYTDGLIEASPASRTALAETSARHRGLPLAGQLEMIAQDFAGTPSDPADFTLFGIEMQ